MPVVIRDFTETEQEFKLLEVGESEALEESFLGCSFDSDSLERRIAWLVSGKCISWWIISNRSGTSFSTMIAFVFTFLVSIWFRGIEDEGTRLCC